MADTRRHDSESNEVLAKAANAGDDAAASELFRRINPVLVRLLYRWTEDEEESKQLAQETWAKALPSFRQHKGAKFMTWVDRIATNVGRDYGRKKEVRRRYLLQLNAQAAKGTKHRPRYDDEVAADPDDFDSDGAEPLGEGISETLPRSLFDFALETSRKDRDTGTDVHFRRLFARWASDAASVAVADRFVAPAARAFERRRQWRIFATLAP